MAHSNRYDENFKKIDRDLTYSLSDAVGIIKTSSPA